MRECDTSLITNEVTTTTIAPIVTPNRSTLLTTPTTSSFVLPSSTSLSVSASSFVPSTALGTSAVTERGRIPLPTTSLLDTNTTTTTSAVLPTATITSSVTTMPSVPPVGSSAAMVTSSPHLLTSVTSYSPLSTSISQSTAMFAQLPPIQRFSGEDTEDGETFQEWHEQFEAIAQLAGWDDHVTMES